MTQQTSNSRFSKQHLILLPASILTGSIAGLIGYIIGQYFYMLFAFPFILLAIGLAFFLPILKFIKTSSAPYNVLCGLLMGLMIFITFHYTEYSIFNSRITARIQSAQNMSQTTAFKSLDSFLKDKTGFGGFIGFMKYQQSQWRPYVYYFVKDGNITGSQDLALRGGIAWLYLAGEAGLLAGGLALTGFFAGKKI